MAAAEGGADDVGATGRLRDQLRAGGAAGVREAIDGAGFPVESVEVALRPEDERTVEDEPAARKILRLWTRWRRTTTCRTSTRTSTSPKLSSKPSPPE